MMYRLSVLLIVLATLLATALAAPTKAPLLNAYRFRDWQQVKNANTDDLVFQAWQQPVADLPREVTGYTLIAYQAERVSTAALANHRMKTFTEKLRFSDYAGRGYVVTVEPWYLDGQQGAFFTVRGMDHKSDHIVAHRAEVYTFVAAVDDWVVLAELRQSFSAEDLAPVDKAAKNAKGNAMAEEFARYVRSVWVPTIETPAAEPATEPKLPTKQADPVKAPEVVKEPELVVDPQPTKQPETVKTPEPVKQPETIKEPEPVQEPVVEPVKQPEPVKEPAVVQPEPVKAPEPEPVKQPEPVKDPEPVKQPETVQPPAVEPTKQPEPVKTPEAVTPPEPARWKTADGHLSLVLPAGWTVTGNGPYDFSAPDAISARLYPAEAYANEAALTRALRAFVATQRDISVNDKKNKFAEAPFTVDGATGVQVHYLNYVRHTTHAYAVGKSGRLWVLEVDVPTEDAAVPPSVAALTASLRVD